MRRKVKKQFLCLLTKSSTMKMSSLNPVLRTSMQYQMNRKVHVFILRRER